MQFIKNFLLNLVILIVFGLAIYLISPSTIMSQVFSLYWWLIWSDRDRSIGRFCPASEATKKLSPFLLHFSFWDVIRSMRIEYDFDSRLTSNPPGAVGPRSQPIPVASI